MKRPRDKRNICPVAAVLFCFSTVIRGIFERVPEGTTKKVPENKILSVVEIETCVVDRVVRGAVDKRQFKGGPIMYIDRP